MIIVFSFPLEIELCCDQPTVYDPGRFGARKEIVCTFPNNYFATYKQIYLKAPKHSVKLEFFLEGMARSQGADASLAQRSRS